jgi:hypothetical protein
MSAERRPRRDPDTSHSEDEGEWVQVPAVVDADGNKVVTLHDDRGRPATRQLAEVVLEAFVGPRPPGHVIRFKDGDRLNCKLANLEWAPAPTVRGEGARARAIATRERADAIRGSLEGRHHSDSAELVAEDRAR